MQVPGRTMRDEMDLALERRWARVVRRRERMLAELGTWPEEELRARPAGGGWCALEVVEHLVRSDLAVLQMMEGARGERPAVPAGDRVRAWMVLGVMWLPTRVAMPKAVEELVKPGSVLELAALRAEWERVDALLHEYVSGLSEAERRKGVARHPVSGWLDARAGVRFLESHLVHHGYQVRRLRKRQKL